MNRRRAAVTLALLVVFSGVLPITLLAAAGLQLLQRGGERASNAALDAIAAQAVARLSAYVAQQREMLRTLASAVGTEPDGARKLREASLDAPSLGRLRIVTKDSPQADLPAKLSPAQLAQALNGGEVFSPTYTVDLAPAMDACAPTGAPGKTVCATLDLLELQRQVQRIRVGREGYALAFDSTGRLIGAGEGALRASVLSGKPVAESVAAAALARGVPAPRRLHNAEDRDVLAGWAFLQEGLDWIIAIEQPADEALRGAREALIVLGLGAFATLLLSISLGYAQARKMLAGLEMEERFRTAGQLAAGITHDLGHRLAILKQIEQLAATGDPGYLPRIRESLAAEVGTIRRFVADFSDLTREAKPAEFTPVELNAFAHSIQENALAYAAETGVSVEVKSAPASTWIRGDRFLLERAVLNLTRNAIEASPRGSRVLLSVSRDEDLADLQVEDQGTGIAADRLSGLFESFNSTKRTGAHVGMGLPNVRRIVIAHGGSVSVKSTMGKGSVFTITLPAQSSSPSFS
ncbi:MAG TPA: ATP-binding protein [Myxococcales bacterium]|nr:ATP-binding protein [Myxococcales bacterium]